MKQKQSCRSFFCKAGSTLIAGVTLLISGCESLPFVAKGKKTVPVVATAYGGGSSCNGPWAGKNAIGRPLKSGIISSAASDWSRLPLGTEFRVAETGRIYIIDDYGSAMVGKDKVDLYKPSYRDVYNWGVKNVHLEILKWGCFQKSLAILRPRAKWAHVKMMVDDLEERLGRGG
jgi:3D (Asp-Asp-Asp) domain-containing protein